MPKSDSATTTPAQRRRIRWGKNLGDALERHGHTPRTFQRALEDAGHDISLASIYFWLRGEFGPTDDNQAAISSVLDEPAHELFPIVAAEGDQ